METVEIEICEEARDRVAEFIQETADGIENGYGAGNCSSDSMAFWTTITGAKLDDGWFKIMIEIEGENLSEHDIAAAVRKVGTKPEGQIEIFGKIVGKWTTQMSPDPSYKVQDKQVTI